MDYPKTIKKFYGHPWFYHASLCPGIPKVEQKITESELFFCPIIFPRIKKVHSATDKPLIALRQYLTGLLPSLTAL
jgi:hypothetical protein